jgi:hypothetical protein
MTALKLKEGKLYKVKREVRLLTVRNMHAKDAKGRFRRVPRNEIIMVVNLADNVDRHCDGVGSILHNDNILYFDYGSPFSMNPSFWLIEATT